MQPITRIYASHQDADKAVHELQRYGYPANDIHVVSPQPQTEPSGAHPAGLQIVTSLANAGISGSAAERYADGIRAGGTLVAVRTMFGAGLLATRILDDHNPDTSGVTHHTDHAGESLDDPAPLSNMLGIPVLSRDPAPLSRLFGIKVLTRGRASASAAMNMPELSSEPAPLSHAVKLPVLSPKPAPLSSLFHLPVLSGIAAPLSALFKMRVLSNEAAPLSARLGMNTLASEPAPLSKLLNLPVLLREKRQTF